MTCFCENIEMGSYEAQVICEFPFPTDRHPDGGKFVGIDLCILPTVADLWKRGIQTVESCCGHGKYPGYIAVPAEHENSMIEAGFHRDHRTKAPGCFIWPQGEGR